MQIVFALALALHYQLVGKAQVKEMAYARTEAHNAR
jgi:hypothetical protein